MNSSRMLALAIACAAACTPLMAADAAARSKEEIRKTIEAAMELTGTLDISTTGTVEALNLDNEEKIDPAVVKSVQSLVAAWQFEPVLKDGQVVPARTPVKMRLLARQAGQDSVSVSIDDASFKRYDRRNTEEVRSRRITPPAFPERAWQLGAAGDLTLILEIGRDGKPMNVAVEQVNLHVLLLEQEMQRVRDAFAKASVNTAKRWQFDIPSTGPLAAETSWTIRVPITFAYTDRRAQYGKWQAFVPGPKFPAQWNYKGKGTEADKGTLLSDGGVYMAGINTGPKLLTPLGG